MTVSLDTSQSWIIFVVRKHRFKFFLQTMDSICFKTIETCSRDSVLDDLRIFSSDLPFVKNLTKDLSRVSKAIFGRCSFCSLAMPLTNVVAFSHR